MESGYDSMNSSTEEVDQPEQESTEVAAGRSYDCMFCKRGFTTAQALGGHMNIHRKDRAKNRPASSINSNKQEENYAAPIFYLQPISSYQQPPYSAAPEVPVNYRTYFPAATSGARPSYAHLDIGQNPLCLNPFEEDWRMSLSLQFGSAQAADVEKKKQGGGEKHEIDLELRLGYDHDFPIYLYINSILKSMESEEEMFYGWNFGGRGRVMNRQFPIPDF
ncbi:hypothetical protein F0562_021158 [Nyssa sinensis]|uniref:C2H2-type domain-containing protein n=1 Tax=Nyssa sinensis TaxID=561372 RepID=A0A5J5BNF0_9ASTE|nr:hypothetical protein F0562_021158 [Nyssa sinensis]